MKDKKFIEKLVNYVVKSTQNVVMIDPETQMPLNAGSGCLITYKERLFFVSVRHVTDKFRKQAAIDTGFGDENGNNLFVLPALNYLSEFSIDRLEVEETVLRKLQSLDICYAEITGSIEIKQQRKELDGIVVTPDLKNLIYSNLDYNPVKEEKCLFYGKVEGFLDDGKPYQTDKLLSVKYDKKIGSYDRFVLDEEISDEFDFQSAIGAPIFSGTGEPIALLAYGYAGEKYLYGFSLTELRKYLNIYLQQNPIEQRATGLGSTLFEIVDEYKHINLERKTEGMGSFSQPLNFDDDFKTTNKQPIPVEGLKRRRLKSSPNNVKKLTDEPKENVEPDYISYPVLYGTDRNKLEGQKIEYGNERGEKLHLGTCEVSIPNAKFHKMGNLERPNWFTNIFGKESPKKHFTILDNKFLDDGEFINMLTEKIGKSEEKDALLFIHGFNVDFKEAMLRTAQLGYDLNFKGAVTAFSWASAGSIGAYLADSDTAELSASYLCDYIKKLLQPSVKKLHIIAHSMGNVVLTEALLQLKNEGFLPNAAINQVILAAPDIDRNIFIKQIMPAINGNFGLTLYASDKDKALIVSKKIKKGYPRLGEGGENIVVLDGLDSVDASEVDTGFLGHGYFYDTQALLNDIHMLLEGLSPSQRMLQAKNKVENEREKSYWIFKYS